MTTKDTPMSAERDIVEAMERVEAACRRAEEEYPRLAAPDGTAAVQFDDLRALLTEITRLREALAQSPEDAEWLRKEATLWRASASFDATAEYKADRLEAIANRLSGVRE